MNIIIFLKEKASQQPPKSVSHVENDTFVLCDSDSQVKAKTFVNRSLKGHQHHKELLESPQSWESQLHVWACTCLCALVEVGPTCRTQWDHVGLGMEPSLSGSGASTADWAIFPALSSVFLNIVRENSWGDFAMAARGPVFPRLFWYWCLSVCLSNCKH